MLVLVFAWIEQACIGGWRVLHGGSHVVCTGELLLKAQACILLCLHRLIGNLIELCNWLWVTYLVLLGLLLDLTALPRLTLLADNFLASIATV